MAFTELVDKLPSGSRNLNTSPWTVSGLKGDQFDYSFMVFCDSGSTTNGDLEVTLNSDVSTNYEHYRMQGRTTNQEVTSSTGLNAMDFPQATRSASSRNTLIVGTLQGESGNERYVTTLYSSGYNPRIMQSRFIWTNTIDELTSVTFTGGVSASYTWEIYVWAVPKLNNNDNWELVDTLSWSASSTEQSFTGLDGDTSKYFKLLWDSQDAELQVEINNDATAAYKREQVRNTGSAFTATSGTDNNILVERSGMLSINAETGDERTSIGIHGGDGTNKQFIRANWHTDTATELTSLYCTPSAPTTATTKLFRSKYPSSCIPDMFDLPFEKVDEFSVNSEDFTSGHTFSNLNGDSVVLYRLEWKGLKDNLSLNVRTNGDSGASDFAWQRLTGSGTAESAASDTADTSLRWIQGGDTAEQAHGVMYIYPQSGEYRPALSYMMCDENEIELAAGWRLDTATEITSINVYATATTTVNGTFTLSAIYL